MERRCEAAGGEDGRTTVLLQISVVVSCWTKFLPELGKSKIRVSCQIDRGGSRWLQVQVELLQGRAMDGGAELVLVKIERCSLPLVDPRDQASRQP